MDMVRRAHLMAIKEIPELVKVRVYDKADLPRELGKYPKEREVEIE